ncbi:MAG TPA: 3-oxoadipate enol-lactonase [Noviherbaspirillum sp.]|jgi:3-oxoadipate enol-lactonase|uniref:3-oxoadipate enol-lactonase n=1 Tax=Noviherbaspirillum sp. TaxID=1926288 RepID=UPI002DDCB741|nr:3-oxoadipate enol-lactonase [Noviherbaspirillum sp.]HEV2611889.1 3-oxoadipate enol-lactonase [Noviherbaspirillum sp.]
MPFFDSKDVRLHYRIDGRGDDERAPWLILSNSLGTTLDMWAPQMTALRSEFRILRYDTRGHGESGVPAGPYDIAQLGSDVVSLMDHAGIPRAHFCGLSMGGMTGLWLGINQPERIDRLALCNTGAKIGTPDAWNTRIHTVNAEGMAAIVPAVLDRWFTPGYRQQAQEEIERVRQMLLQTPAAGYTANCAAVRDMDQRDGVSTITAPTLVIAGTHDLATTPQDGRFIADRIAGARYVELDAAHLSNMEQAEAFNRTLADFLLEGAGRG